MYFWTVEKKKTEPRVTKPVTPARGKGRVAPATKTVAPTAPVITAENVAAALTEVQEKLKPVLKPVKKV